MKRRTFLTGVGGGVSGIGVLGLVESNGCSNPEVEAGVFVESVSESGVTVGFDGFGIENVEWLAASRQMVARIDLTKSTCGMNQTTIPFPEENISQQEVYLKAQFGDSEVIFGRLVRGTDGSWVALYSNKENVEATKEKQTA